jgi:hypothetical protein
MFDFISRSKGVVMVLSVVVVWYFWGALNDVRNEMKYPHNIGERIKAFVKMTVTYLFNRLNG